MLVMIAYPIKELTTTLALRAFAIQRERNQLAADSSIPRLRSMPDFGKYKFREREQVWRVVAYHKQAEFVSIAAAVAIGISLWGCSLRDKL